MGQPDYGVGPGTHPSQQQWQLPPPQYYGSYQQPYPQVQQYYQYVQSGSYAAPHHGFAAPQPQPRAQRPPLPPGPPPHSPPPPPPQTPAWQREIREVRRNTEESLASMRQSFEDVLARAMGNFAQQLKSTQRTTPVVDYQGEVRQRGAQAQPSASLGAPPADTLMPPPPTRTHGVVADPIPGSGPSASDIRDKRSFVPHVEGITELRTDGRNRSSTAPQVEWDPSLGARSRDTSAATVVPASRVEPSSPAARSASATGRSHHSPRGSRRSRSGSSRASTRDSSGGSRDSRSSHRPDSLSSRSPSPGRHNQSPSSPREGQSSSAATRKRRNDSRRSASPSHKRRRRPDGVPEPTESEVRVYRAKLVDRFCAEHKDYDRRDTRDLERIESTYVTLDFARSELIKKWSLQRQEYKAKRAGTTSRDTMPRLSPQNSVVNVTINTDPTPQGLLQMSQNTLVQQGAAPVAPLPQLSASASTEEKTKARERIRTIIAESTALRGLQPAAIPVDDKRDKLSTWDSAQQGQPKQREERLAWPVHFRVREVTEAINKKLPKLTEPEAKLPAADYTRVPPAALPDPDFPDYVLLSEALPGWTSKRPTSTAPLEKQVAPDKAAAEVSFKGLREAAGDWRQALSLASVLSHSIDTLDELTKVPDAERTPQMIRDNLEVARAGLSKLVLTATKNIANHSLWERKRTQNLFLDSSLARLSLRDLAECRTGPVDSEEYVFGSNRDRHTELVRQRTEERFQTISVQLDSRPSQQPFQGAGTIGAKPAQPAKSAKGKSRPRPKKPKKQDKPKADSPKSVEPTKTDKPESAAGKKPYAKKGKKKGAGSKKE